MTQGAKKPTLLKRIFNNQNGNVAMIFALSVIPILSIAGFAIDFQMTTTRKNKVQTVMDSAVLAGARAMQAGNTEQEIRDIVSSYMAAQLTTVGTTLNCQDTVISFPEGSQDINLDILCYQDTSLMKIVGKDTMGFRVGTSSTWGIGKLDVAFMFDVSGSMNNDNRMTYLKAAAQEAVDTLLPEDGGAATEDVRIAMVSYNSMVNAGDYFEDVTGLTPTRTYHATNTYTDWEVTGTEMEWQNVRVASTERYCKWYKYGRCRSWGYRTVYNWEWQEVEVDVWEEVEGSEEVTKTITSTCVWERRGDNKFSDFAPTNSAPGEPVLPTTTSDIYNANSPIYYASEDADNPYGYLAAGYAYYDDDDDRWRDDGRNDCASTEPVPLTNTRSTLSSYITSLRTGGGTAGQQGVAWSWYLVAEPWQSIFTGDNAPLDYTEPDSVKAVILMTDGEFNREEFDEQGDSDAQARDVCDAMKTNGSIIIYTVAFQAPTSGQAVLDYCSSGPEFSFSPNNGEELSQAYQAIATSISDLRISY